MMSCRESADLKSCESCGKETSGFPSDGVTKLSSQSLYKSIEDQAINKLNIVLKTDVQGSLEAIDQILGAIKSKEVGINFIREGVGDITESDVKLGQNSKAVVLGSTASQRLLPKGWRK